MKWLLWIGLLLVTLVAAVAVIGWLLPVGHTASRHAVLAAPPSEIYAVISDVERYPAWWSEISKVEMLPADTGAVRFRQYTGTGPIVMEVIEAVSPSRRVTKIADPDQLFGGTWTFDITPEGSGTRLTITERGEVYNPIFRFMARFVFGYAGTMESCLAALAAKTAAR